MSESNGEVKKNNHKGNPDGCKGWPDKRPGATRRPYKFTPKKQEKFLELTRQGVRRSQAAKRIGLCIQTIINYMNGNPEFAELVDEAEMHVDDNVENALYETAIGGHHQAQQFWLTNRRPHIWQDRRFGGGNKTTVTSIHGDVKIEQQIENADPEEIMDLLKRVRSLGGKPTSVIETEARRIDVDDEDDED